MRAMRWFLTSTVLASCASADTPPEPAAPEPAPDGRAEPGPMRPLAADTALDQAPALGLDNEGALRVWLAERLAAAHAGRAERVRLPLVRRAADAGHGRFAIAASAESPLSYPIAVHDLTSAGVPTYATPGWLGWVDGRFTGQTEAGPTGEALPVVEVLRQSTRTSDEPAVVRVAVERAP